MSELGLLRKQISELKAKPALDTDDSDVRRIYNYCVHLLARQDYSEFKLRQKLRSKPQNLPHMIEEALTKIKAKGLLREDAYRRLFIRKWMMRGESEEKIRKRGSLERLEFQEGEFASCSQELGFTDDDSLLKLISKKLRSKEIPKDSQGKAKVRDKVLKYLISKGHGFSASRKAIEKFLSRP